MGRRTYRMILSYDGTGYQGWQRLPGKQTLQGRIEQALTEIFGERVEISGSGRTDMGVHARGQVASFTARELPPGQILPRLRHMLPSDIGVLRLDYAADRFHARLCATGKTYVYRVWNSEMPDVFGRRYRLSIPKPLDVEQMRRAAAYLLGRHDFTAFCANKQFKKSPVRELRQIELRQEGAELSFYLTADGFLHHMVRIIVGTLLEVGQGKRQPEEMADILHSCKRENAGETAAARGLCLEQVYYD